MAKNTGKHHRHGEECRRSQCYNGHTDHWVERDTRTGQFTGVKHDNKPFKGVRKEKCKHHRR
jgi:hypothetical protein